MKKLIRIHFRYFIDKFSIILISSLFIIGIIFFLILGLTLPKMNFVDSYSSLSLSIIKFISVLFSINIFTFSGLPKNDSYANIWVTSKIERSKYIITKLSVYSLIVISFITVMFLSFIVMGIISNEYFNFSDYKSVLIVSITAIYYGVIANILVKILPNYLISFVTIILFLFGDFLANLISTESVLLDLYSVVFPIISNVNNELYLKSGLTIIIVFPVVVMSMYHLYMIKDL